MGSDLEHDMMRQVLKAIIDKRTPSFAEIIPEGYCPHQCVHCVYPPDYHLLNRNLSASDFAAVLDHLYYNFHLRRYIFGGRSYTSSTISIIQKFKEKHPGITLGIIGDGPNLAQFIDRLDVFDWVDVSLDGWGEIHDRQRGEQGSFKITLDALRKIRRSGKVKRTSILSCLTTINKDSILEMIQKLNSEGFKNFFVSPVHISKFGRPEVSLQMTQLDFANFAVMWLKMVNTLSKAWLSLDIYEHYYCQAILNHAPAMFHDLKPMDFSLETVARKGDVESHISYFPISLNLLHEFIVNCDGRNIPPMVMARGKIPESSSFGHVLTIENMNTLTEDRLETQAFDFYVNNLIQERQVFKSAWPG